MEVEEEEDEKEKNYEDDIDDVIRVGKEVPALELGAFRVRSIAAVSFGTRNSAHLDAVLPTPSCKNEPVFYTSWHPHSYTVLCLSLVMTVAYAVTDFFYSFPA